MLRMARQLSTIPGHIHHVSPGHPTACAAGAVRPIHAGVTDFVTLRGITILGAYFAPIQLGRPRIVSSSAWVWTAMMEMVSSFRRFPLPVSRPNSHLSRRQRWLRASDPMSRRQLLLRHRHQSEQLLRTRPGSLHRQEWSNHRRQSIIHLVTEYCDFIISLYNPDDILNKSSGRCRRLANIHWSLRRHDQNEGENHKQYWCNSWRRRRRACGRRINCSGRALVPEEAEN